VEEWKATPACKNTDTGTAAERAHGSNRHRVPRAAVTVLDVEYGRMPLSIKCHVEVGKRRLKLCEKHNLKWHAALPTHLLHQPFDIENTRIQINLDWLKINAEIALKKVKL
jgi:hypothetical protein